MISADFGATLRAPALAGALRRCGRRLASMAPEVVTSDVLKPRRAPQSPCQGSIYGCLLAGAYLRVATAWSPTARAWPAELPESCRWPATPDGRDCEFATTPRSCPSAMEPRARPS